MRDAGDTGVKRTMRVFTSEVRRRSVIGFVPTASPVRFSTAFGRGFDYYTGFVFELHEASGANGPLIAGGRYDGLLTRLGAKTPIPAVGFSVWVERLAAFKGAT